MTYGRGKRGSLHAPSVLLDSTEPPIVIFNVTENRLHPEWRQMMSLPRQLSLNDGNRTGNPVERGAVRHDSTNSASNPSPSSRACVSTR